MITWKGVSQPFFIGGKGIKVNGASYMKHLRDALIRPVEATYPNKDFIFVQDTAPSHHTNQVQKQKLKFRFVKNTTWPPKLPDYSPLGYYLLDSVQEKVYIGHYCYPIKTIDELKRRIRDVWNECAADFPQISKSMKQFIPRLQIIGAKEGDSIKAAFG